MKISKGFINAGGYRIMLTSKKLSVDLTLYSHFYDWDLSFEFGVSHRIFLIWVGPIELYMWKK